MAGGPIVLLRPPCQTGCWPPTYTFKPLFRQETLIFDFQVLHLKAETRIFAVYLRYRRLFRAFSDLLHPGLEIHQAISSASYARWLLIS